MSGQRSEEDDDRAWLRVMRVEDEDADDNEDGKEKDDDDDTSEASELDDDAVDADAGKEEADDGVNEMICVPSAAEVVEGERTRHDDGESTAEVFSLCSNCHPCFRAIARTRTNRLHLHHFALPS